MTISEMKAGIKLLPHEVRVVAGENRESAVWNVHNCSLCGYPCGYIINVEPREGEGEVFYDSGCDCTCGGPNYRPSSFENMYDHYKLQINQEYIASIEKLFGVTSVLCNG